MMLIQEFSAENRVNFFVYWRTSVNVLWSKDNIKFDRGERLNLFISSSFQFSLTLWNPTIHPVTIFPRVPVTGEYSIRDPQGNLLSAEVRRKVLLLEWIVCVQYLPIEESVKKIPGRQSRAMNEHIFEASLPPLGFNTYQFKLKSTSEQKRIIETTRNDLCVLENEVRSSTENEEREKIRSV